MIKIGDVIKTNNNVSYPLVPNKHYVVAEVHDLGVTVKEEEPSSYSFVEYEMFTVVYAQEGDAVNHPNHYTQGKYETIDIIEHTVSGYSDPFVAHCVGTATKYLNRAPFKHETPLEDIRKAYTYLGFAIKRLEKEDAS